MMKVQHCAYFYALLLAILSINFDVIDIGNKYYFLISEHVCSVLGYALPGIYCIYNNSDRKFRPIVFLNLKM